MSDNTKSTCSICGGEGAVTAFGSYESAELEAQLAECRKVRHNYSMGVDPIEYNELYNKGVSMQDELIEIKAQLAEVTAQNARLTEAADWDTLNVLSDEVEDYKKQLAELQAQLGVMRAEITRLRAGGCAREQGTTQYCGEMQALVVKLSAIADAWNDGSYDEERNDTLKYCARRLRKAISGEGQEVAAKLASLTICTGALSVNAHHWREIDSQSNTVRCVRCGVFGKMDNSTRDITFSVT